MLDPMPIREEPVMPLAYPSFEAFMTVPLRIIIP